MAIALKIAEGNYNLGRGGGGVAEQRSSELGSQLSEAERRREKRTP